MTMTREERIASYRQGQPLAELRRKAEKAVCRSNLWTQEELDLADAEATDLAKNFCAEFWE